MAGWPSLPAVGGSLSVIDPPHPREDGRTTDRGFAKLALPIWRYPVMSMPKGHQPGAGVQAGYINGIPPGRGEFAETGRGHLGLAGLDPVRRGADAKSAQAPLELALRPRFAGGIARIPSRLLFGLQGDLAIRGLDRGALRLDLGLALRL